MAKDITVIGNLNIILEPDPHPLDTGNAVR